MTADHRDQPETGPASDFLENHPFAEIRVGDTASLDAQRQPSATSSCLPRCRAM